MSTQRIPDHTRQALLEAAFEEIHCVGFQAASLSKILQRTGVTKGALYHHFSSKKAMGYAVVDEVIRERMLEGWVTPMLNADDPIDVLINVLTEDVSEMGEMLVTLGCPLNNLAQEMSPVDEGFRHRIESIFRLWRNSIADGLRRGQASGVVRSDRDADVCALFIVAAIEGCVGAAKCAQSRDVLASCGAGLIDYLQSLKGTSL